MTTINVFPEKPVTSAVIPLQTGYFNHIFSLVSKAEKSISICQYVFSTNKTRNWQRSNKILKSLVSAAARGVELRVLFDRPKLNSPNIRSNIRTVDALREGNIIAKCLAVNKALHIKMLIIDKKIFLAGSHNLTDSSLYSPYELSFECRDEYMVNCAGIYFECLWNGNLSQDYRSAVEDMAYQRKKKFYG